LAQPINLELLPRRIIDTVDRRVLGAFQFVDAVTGLPVVVPAQIEVRGATIAGVPQHEARREHAIRIRQNRRGIAVIFRAPLFDTYASAFDDPVPLPVETATDPLRLRLAVVDAGPHYLPQEFHVDLPRALDFDAPDSVFHPQRVRLFRAPNAPVQDGWALLRVLVTSAGNPAARLPGVLVRVVRAEDNALIGEGMTDWRGDITGEALVPLPGIQRFRPGSGDDVIETDEAIAFELARHASFTGAAGQLPDVPALLAGTGTGLIHPPDLPPGSSVTVLRPAPSTPPTAMRVQAGREYSVHLAMP
jgi:hypothetical protein